MPTNTLIKFIAAVERKSVSILNFLRLGRYWKESEIIKKALKTQNYRLK
jgi:hypothetical protein